MVACRPFGETRSDLDIDFGRPVPVVVTDVLNACFLVDTGPTNKKSTSPWDLTVGTRIGQLLDIAALTTGPTFAFPFRCATETCGELLEIAVTMEDLAESRERSGSPDEVAVALGTKELRLRKATGRDQRAWMERRFGDEPAARRFMIGTLVTQWSGPEPFDSEGLSEESLDLIDGEMREADPLVYFTISTSCPACGASMTCEADFEQLALSTFSGAQRRLIEEVHRFAYYYNWSEDQVFDVPVWRRRRFLSLIDKEHSS